VATITSRQHSETCTHCGAAVIGPEWSESVDEQKTIHIWHCVVCGNEFETKDEVIEEKPSNAELVERFLPNLLVE
jgi:Rieske Fe-S protein